VQDVDIVWFRNPFRHISVFADMTTSSDVFSGDVDSLDNWPNTGFFYVKATNRTVEMLLSETERRRENASSSEETNDEHESLVLPRAQRFLGLYCYLLNYKAERCKPRRTRLRRVRTSIPMRRNSRPWLACSSSCRAILVHDFLRTR